MPLLSCLHQQRQVNQVYVRPFTDPILHNITARGCRQTDYILYSLPAKLATTFGVWRPTTLQYLVDARMRFQTTKLTIIYFDATHITAFKFNKTPHSHELIFIIWSTPPRSTNLLFQAQLFVHKSDKEYKLRFKIDAPLCKQLLPLLLGAEKPHYVDVACATTSHQSLLEFTESRYVEHKTDVDKKDGNSVHIVSVHETNDTQSTHSYNADYSLDANAMPVDKTPLKLSIDYDTLETIDMLTARPVVVPTLNNGVYADPDTIELVGLLLQLDMIEIASFVSEEAYLHMSRHQKSNIMNIQRIRFMFDDDVVRQIKQQTCNSASSIVVTITNYSLAEFQQSALVKAPVRFCKYCHKAVSKSNAVGTKSTSDNRWCTACKLSNQSSQAAISDEKTHASTHPYWLPCGTTPIKHRWSLLADEN